jgi:hypothetical protein
MEPVVFLAYFGAGAVGAEAGYLSLNPQLGFTVAGALNVLADGSQHVNKSWLQSFITGGFSGLSGAEVGVEFAEAEVAGKKAAGIFAEEVEKK